MMKQRFERTIFSHGASGVTALKTAGWVPLALLVFVFFSWVRPVQAEQKTIEIPKGAKIQKLGPGHFKFVLPSNRLVELKGLNPRTGEAGSIELIDPDPPYKPLAGKQVKLNLRRLTPAQAGKLTGRDYLQIDDDIAWLPLSITFQSTEPEDKPSPVKPIAAPMKPNTTLAPSVVAPTLPIRIDSITMGTEWIPERATWRLIIDGTRTVAGEILRPVKVDLLWNGTIIRSYSTWIPGPATRFVRDFRIDWGFLPGTYQVKLEYDSKTYTSRELKTKTGYRFAD